MNRNVRSATLTAEQRYQHGALTAAEGYAAVLWLAIWLVNAFFTIAMVRTLGMPWYVGIPIHLSVSFIEQHLWRSRRWSAWALVLGASFVDVFSSAWGLQSFLTARGAPSGAESVIAASIYTLLAFVIALAPERSAIGHVFAISRLLKRRNL